MRSLLYLISTWHISFIILTFQQLSNFAICILVLQIKQALRSQSFQLTFMYDGVKLCNFSLETCCKFQTIYSIKQLGVICTIYQ